MSKELSTSQNLVENQIFTVRKVQIMIDYHLAELYEVETKRINEQVKRNAKRFPENFMFQLTEVEWENLQSQIATTENKAGLQSQIATTKRRTIPYVFTEQGVAMLSAVLNSDTAIMVSIQVMNAFVKMRELLSDNSLINHRSAVKSIVLIDNYIDLCWRGFAISSYTKYELASYKNLYLVLVSSNFSTLPKF